MIPVLVPVHSYLDMYHTVLTQVKLMLGISQSLFYKQLQVAKCKHKTINYQSQDFISNTNMWKLIPLQSGKKNNFKRKVKSHDIMQLQMRNRCSLCV